MSLFSKRNLLVGISTFIIGLGAFAAIWGMPRFLTPSATIKSQAAVYLLDDRGAVNGLLLTSGDQLHFSQQTGEAVAAQIKVGDEVTVTGRAGSQSNYGREVRVQQISANGNTIIEADAGPKRTHGPLDGRKSKGHGDRPAPPDVPAQRETGTEQQSVAAASGADANRTENSQPAPMETFQATGTIKTHLVNGHGDVDGLILSSGEQVRFSPKVGKLVVAAEQGADTQVSVQGTGVRNELGTVMRPAFIRIGDQTITLER